MDFDGLQDLFIIFNTTGHPLYRGHSMSVSDVVVTDEGAFFCNNIGFAQVDFDESQTQKPDDLMRVVYVEPGKPAYEAEIRNDLYAEQQAVGGLIEPVYLEEDICIVGNEESKLIGLSGNRRLENGTIMAGNKLPTLIFLPKHILIPTAKINTEPTNERFAITTSVSIGFKNDANKVILP